MAFVFLENTRALFLHSKQVLGWPLGTSILYTHTHAHTLVDIEGQRLIEQPAVLFSVS